MKIIQSLKPFLCLFEFGSRLAIHRKDLFTGLHINNLCLTRFYHLFEYNFSHEFCQD